MKCAYHNDKDAEFFCSSCGKPICSEDLAVVNGKNVCKACEYNIKYNAAQYGKVPYNTKEYRSGDGVNGFLFFIFLAVPGLRQMYIGLMKRGLEFLITFFGIIGFGILLGNGIGEIVIPITFIVWFYSAFDSFQARRLMAKGEIVEDRSIFAGYGLDEVKGFLMGRKKVVGIAITALGAYLLLKRLRWYIGAFNLPRVLYSIYDFAFNSIIPILLIIAGVYLMSKVGKKESEPKLENMEMESE